MKFHNIFMTSNSLQNLNLLSDIFKSILIFSYHKSKYNIRFQFLIIYLIQKNTIFLKKINKFMK
jgi:hypothetical protein